MPVGAQKIQYCRCKINLAGQNCHTVYFTEHDPVTWPEIQVLQFLHGEENVMEIMPVGIGETYPTNEKNRLATIYGFRPVEACFPGRSFRMEYLMTADTDLPFYVDGVLAGPGDIPYGQPLPRGEPPKPPEPGVPPLPKNPPPFVKPTELPPGEKPIPTLDPPGTDHDDGEDDEKEALAASIAFSPGEPVFKPGRSKPPNRPGV